jgi:formyltetrahydrofolate synthetase
MHGGGPAVMAGKPLAFEYENENLELLEAGCANMQHHIRNAKKFGVEVVVAVNQFHTDTMAEIELVAKKAMEAGAYAAVRSNHWAEGGAGAIDLAHAVIEACAKSRAQPESSFKFLYPLEYSIEQKIETVCKEIYGAASVTFSEKAQGQIVAYTAQGYGNLPICNAKTHLSLSTDASKKGVPTGFNVEVREIRASIGAGFLYPLLGDIMTIPGLPTRPGFYDVDLDVETGRVIGLF